MTSERQSLPSSPPSSSGRAVGPLALLALGINGIVGVGIFFVPADLAKQAPGMASVLVVALTALCMTPVAIAHAKLGGVFDEDGGPVVFARAAFGELPSFLVGWLTFLSSIFSAAAIMVGLARSLTPHPAAPYAIATILTVVCAGGVQLSARVWTTLTILKLLPLTALVLVSVFVLGASVTPAEQAPVAEAQVSWSRAALTTVFIYQGFEVVPVLAGQARAPAKAIPRAVLGSLALAALLYVLLQRACIVAVTDLTHSGSPVADAAAALAGNTLSRAVRLGTSISALGIAVGMMVMTPRYLSALAKGDTLPFALDRLASNGIPQRALLVTWLAVVALISLGNRAELFSLSSLAVVLQYVVAAAALARLALAGQRGLRRIDSWSAYPSLAVGLALAFSAAGREWGVAGVCLFIGLALHLTWRRRSRS